MSEQRTLSGNFEVTVNLTDRRGIKMTGYVYSDDSQDDINHRIDAFQNALDRQSIRVDMITKEAQIAGHLLNLKALKDGYEELASLKAGGKKLTSQQQQNMANFDRSVRGATDMIESLKAAIAEGEKKLNGSA